MLLADVIEKTIAATSQTVALKPGDALFRKCDEPDGIYIVKRGSFCEFVGSTPLETVREGGLVGVMTIVKENGRRSATVIASAYCEMVLLVHSIALIEGEYLT